MRLLTEVRKMKEKQVLFARFLLICMWNISW
jgi:hypothetical protein